MTGVLSYADIAPRLGISIPLLRQWVHRGKFPPPDLRPNPRTPLWYEGTVNDYIEGKQ